MYALTDVDITLCPTNVTSNAVVRCIHVLFTNTAAIAGEAQTCFRQTLFNAARGYSKLWRFVCH